MRHWLYTRTTNGLAKFLRTPPYLILFVSDKCQNNCRHCWYNTSWKNENLIGNPLSFDEYVRISSNLRNIRFITYAGGEAFLRDDIAELTHAYIVNAKVSRYDIPTSGFDSARIVNSVETMLRINGDVPIRVDVSLDGLDEVHNSIRQNKNSFSNAVDTIKELKKIREKHRNFDVSVITTISDDNRDSVNELSDFIDEILPVGEWMINIIRGSAPSTDINEDTANAYKLANDIIDEKIRQRKFKGDTAYYYGKLITAKNSLRREIISKIIERNVKGGGCAAGALAGVIYTNGDVRPCETLNYSFGNIRDFNYNLGKMWMSEQGDSIRKNIQYDECLCTHECFLSVSILMQPRWLFKLSKKVLSLR